MLKQSLRCSQIQKHPIASAFSFLVRQAQQLHLLLTRQRCGSESTQFAARAHVCGPSRPGNVTQSNIFGNVGRYHIQVRQAWSLPFD